MHPSTAHSQTSPVMRLDRDKVLQSILRLNSLLSTQADVNEVLSRILDEVVDTIGFSKGIIRLFDSTKQYLEAKEVKNYTPEEREKAFAVALHMQQHDCVAVRVATTGQPIAIEATATDPRFGETDRALTRIYDRGSYFCAPLKIKDEVIGTIAAWFKEETKFFLEEINLFLTYASALSMIIHNSRLFSANAEKIRQLTILQEAVSEMNASYALDNLIFESLVKSAQQIARPDKILACFMDMEGDRTLLSEGGRLILNDRQTGEVRIRGTILAEAMRTNAIISRRATAADALPRPVFPDCLSELALPFKVKDKVQGGLLLAKASGTYPQSQINVLDILVKNASTSYDNAIMHALLSQEAKSLKTEVEILKEREDKLLGFQNIIGQSKKMTGLFHVLKEVAGHNTNILIQGESGTGKELIARALHRQSHRANKPFVDVNCAAIPGPLLESELFGYESGAFTDARKRKLGLLECANGGTLLLDEIGEMDIHLQAKFLRMLEDGYIRRLGGTENVPLDVRFIFSTNRDLARMAAENAFREDLFYRISVVPILIPPLRERGDDLLLLTRHYLAEFNKKFKKRVKGFTPEVDQILMSYHWPGNVRELKNIIERVMILHMDGTMIALEHLPAELKKNTGQERIKLQLDQWLPKSMADGIDFTGVTERISLDIKHQLIGHVLETCQGNKTEAAKRLGISRYKLIREQKKISKTP